MAAAQGAYEAAAALAARQFRVAQRVIKTPPERGAERWQDARVILARRTAVYLAVVAFDAPLRAVARAAGVSHTGVRKALAAIEDAREDAALDARLLQMEQELVA